EARGTRSPLPGHLDGLPRRPRVDRVLVARGAPAPSPRALHADRRALDAGAAESLARQPPLDAAGGARRVGAVLGVVLVRSGRPLRAVLPDIGARAAIEGQA